MKVTRRFGINFDTYNYIFKDGSRIIMRHWHDLGMAVGKRNPYWECGIESQAPSEITKKIQHMILLHSVSGVDVNRREYFLAMESLFEEIKSDSPIMAPIGV